MGCAETVHTTTCFTAFKLLTSLKRRKCYLRKAFRLSLIRRKRDNEGKQLSV